MELEKQPRRIDNKYIKQIYDIEREKQDVEYWETLNTWDFSQHDGASIKDLKKEILSYLNTFPEEAFLDLNYYGYDGAYEILIKKKSIRKETEQEVIKRLKSELRQKRKKDKDIENAINILKKNKVTDYE